MRLQFTVTSFFFCLLSSWSFANHPITLNLSTPLKPIISVQLEVDKAQDLKANFSTKKAQSLLAIYLLIDQQLAPVPLSGEYHLKEQELSFQPIYSLEEGSKFKALYYTKNQTFSTFIDIPILKQQAKPQSEVLDIFPKGTEIPRNVCFFHVLFSQPMQDIRANESIKMFDQNGQAIEKLWRVESYWLNDHKDLILMIHPGRLKRGIDWEIPFVIGEEYTLVIETTLKDVHNQPIAQQFSKKFKIKKEDYQSPSIHFKKFELPSIQTKQPLRLKFSEGLDYGSVMDGVSVINTTTGHPIKGVFLNIDDQQYDFVPDQPWEKLSYKIVFEQILCDFANNRLNRLFETRSIKDEQNGIHPTEWTFNPTLK